MFESHCHNVFCSGHNHCVAISDTENGTKQMFPAILKRAEWLLFLIIALSCINVMFLIDSWVALFYSQHLEKDVNFRVILFQCKWCMVSLMSMSVSSGCSDFLPQSKSCRSGQMETLNCLLEWPCVCPESLLWKMNDGYFFTLFTVTCWQMRDVVLYLDIGICFFIM